MELTVREVATLLGRSPRTVRAQLARGDIPAVKRGGCWSIPRRSLPLTEDQRSALQAKADAVRRAVDAALPSRVATTSGQRGRSVADLDAFRLGARLLADIRAADAPLLALGTRQHVEEELEQSLLALAEAVHLYHRTVKLAALDRCRAALGRVAGRLALATAPKSEPAIIDWLVALESQVLPAVAGFARWADRLETRRS